MSRPQPLRGENPAGFCIFNKAKLLRLLKTSTFTYKSPLSYSWWPREGGTLLMKLSFVHLRLKYFSSSKNVKSQLYHLNNLFWYFSSATNLIQSCSFIETSLWYNFEFLFFLMFIEAKKGWWRGQGRGIFQTSMSFLRRWEIDSISDQMDILSWKIHPLF